MWWNHSAEVQAFGRVFRLGQQKESYFARLWTKTPIDYRMYHMQGNKIRAIDEALQDDRHKTQKLSAGEMMELLGKVEWDAFGKPVRITDDYDDLEERFGRDESSSSDSEVELVEIEDEEEEEEEEEVEMIELSTSEGGDSEDQELNITDWEDMVLGSTDAEPA
jgi:Ran GTPase-activating protein (RanGAP) involved in mRNA processing and transport